MTAAGGGSAATSSALGPRLGRPHWGLVIGGYLLALGAGWTYGAVLRAQGVWHLGASWERSLLSSVGGSLPGWLDTLAYIAPWAGTNLTLGPLVAILAAWLLWRRRPDLAAWITTVELGVLSMNWLIKHLLVRDRPEVIERVGWYGWASYPSGHAMASLAVLMTLALLVRRATGRRWPTWLAFAVFVVISYSRLLHGVHWPTDVVGGILVGLIWLVATWLAFIRLPDAERSPAA